MLRLIQVRDCDGQCCRDAPRFPNKDWSDCIYRIEGSGKDDTRLAFSGCKLMSGAEQIPDEPSVIFVDKTAAEVFKETCLDWPQNTQPTGRTDGTIGSTAGCCWQWRDDGK